MKPTTSASVLSGTTGTAPSWARGLKISGLYYEGIVDNVEAILEQHRKETVTSYGTRNSITKSCFDDEVTNPITL